MNREIKFRAWDYAGGFFEYFNLHEIPLGCSTCFAAQQYTGLKDKNDKEIFEGDIVEYENYFVSKGEKIYDVVCIRPPRFWLENETFGYEGERLVEPSETIVIGNIFENPSLIKVIKPSDYIQEDDRNCWDWAGRIGEIKCE